MTDPQEIELKLDVGPDAAAALRDRLVALLGPSGEPAHLGSVYYDTSRQALRKAGCTLRIRNVGGRRVQTVKAGGEGGGGLFQRAEWETEVPADRPDLDALRDTPVPAILNEAKQPLLPLFETVMTRTVWTVERAGATIEVALDEGRAVAGDRETPIVELECELKGGSVGALFTLLRDFGGDVDLRPGVMPKSDRGYRLARGKPPRAAKAEPVPLNPGMTTAAAFQAIMRACLRHFRLNETLVLQRNPDGLHQARVAMRRLRTALTLFKPIAADPERERLAAACKGVSQHLGAARDLDVYLARVAEEGGLDDAVPRADLEGRRAAAYDRVVATVAGPAFGRLLLDLMVWIEAGVWATSDDPLRRALREQPIEVVAAAMLDRRRRQVKRKGRDLAALDPAARHRLRIAAKKLRYAAEFFAGLARRRKARERHAAFIAAMEDLQQALGGLNDIATGDVLAAGAAGAAAAPADALVVPSHVGGHDDQEAELLRRAVEGHQAVRAAKPFWTRWRGTA